MNKLKHTREKSGLTQEQVALKTGVASFSYVRYENPRYNRYPDVRTAIKIAKVLGTTVEALWGVEQENHDESKQVTVEG